MKKIFDYSLLMSLDDGINIEPYNAIFESFIDKINTRISLNGKYKFILLKDNYLDDIENKYLQDDFNIADLKELTLPSHIELSEAKNFDISRPQYLNTMYP